jgi:hypothetical protein
MKNDVDRMQVPYFERAAAIMHECSPWMLEEKEGLSMDLTSRKLVAVERQMRPIEEWWWR